MFKKDNSDRMGGVVTNSVGIREFCIVFDDKEEANVTIFVFGCNRNMVYAD